MIVPAGYVVRYQPEGPNEKPRMAWIDPAKVPDPRAVLERALGTLVLFEVVGLEPDSRRRVDHARTLAGNSKSLAENDNS